MRRTLTWSWSSRSRSSAVGAWPRSRSSTASATSLWTMTCRQLCCSTRTSKVGGALRSKTVFCVPRRRASPSPNVTACTPPPRSPHPRPAQDQDAPALLDHVADQGDGAAHRPADAAGEADDGATAVAQRADAVQRPPNPCPVVLPKLSDALDAVGEVFRGNRYIAED